MSSLSARARLILFDKFLHLATLYPAAHPAPRTLALSRTFDGLVLSAPLRKAPSVSRRVAPVLGLLLVPLLLMPAPRAVADPTPTPAAAPVAGLTEAEAMAQAKATGQPVVVSAKTDERTLITADPAIVTDDGRVINPFPVNVR